jgi:hypothetical protein
MQLDKTEIVIRQRGTLELMDLSMLVLKRHLGKLLLLGGLLGIPFLILDVFLLKWMISDDTVMSYEMFGSPEQFAHTRFSGHLYVLYSLQFPIVSLPITLFLGAQIFYMPITTKELFRNLLQIFWPTFFVLGVVRLGLVGLLVELEIRNANEFTGWEAILLFVMFPIAILIRTLYPFAPEIIGLERCPVRAKDGQVSYSSRRSNLHSPLQGTLIVRMFAVDFFGRFQLTMVFGAALFLQATLIGTWQWSGLTFMIVQPLAMWLVGIYLAVFRYLSYIDSRIRLEGWEVELRVRAEATRLEQAERPSINSGSLALEGSPQ